MRYNMYELVRRTAPIVSGNKEYMKDNTYFIIGARASGKTTLGRLLAKQLGLGFVDTDTHMLESGGLTVAQVVEREGWEGFRRRESETLRTVTRPRKVIATGGGMVLAPENREFMARNGTVLYLAAPAEVLAARLAASPKASQRPSLTGKSPLEEIGDVLREREELYKTTAHHVLDATREMRMVLEQALIVCGGGKQ